MSIPNFITYFPVLQPKPAFEQCPWFRQHSSAHRLQFFIGNLPLNYGKVIHNFMYDIGLQHPQNLQLLRIIQIVVKGILIEQLHPQQSEVKRWHRRGIILDLRAERALIGLEEQPVK